MPSYSHGANYIKIGTKVFNEIVITSDATLIRYEFFEKSFRVVGARAVRRVGEETIACHYGIFQSVIDFAERVGLFCFVVGVDGKVHDQEEE